jgi:hypothetical protein
MQRVVKTHGFTEERICLKNRKVWVDDRRRETEGSRGGKSQVTITNTIKTEKEWANLQAIRKCQVLPIAITNKTYGGRLTETRVHRKTSINHKTTLLYSTIAWITIINKNERTRKG